ncbi:MAG: ArsR family transcriptional regulator [Sediminibacterium sp.]|nr:MAG: ArsR family transcriptional regulator [Sediminibacterium sp.] [Sediminibacterium sp. FEMGT703S]
MHGIDEIDKQLIRLIRKNNKLTAEELSNKVALSISAIQRRIKRFRDEKIIVSDIAVISKEAMGKAVSCIIEVSLHFGESKVIDKFKKQMTALPEVLHCYYVTGNIDFFILISLTDMHAYEAFSRKYFMDNPDVKQFSTHVLIDTVKFEHGILP